MADLQVAQNKESKIVSASAIQEATNALSEQVSLQAQLSTLRIQNSETSALNNVERTGIDAQIAIESARDRILNDLYSAAKEAATAANNDIKKMIEVEKQKQAALKR